MKNRTIDTKWFSWIPTNIGYLNYNYIADTNNLLCVFGKDNYEKIILNDGIKISLKNTHLSDINEIASELLGYDEILAQATLIFRKQNIFNETIDKDQPIGISGDICIFYNNDLTMNSTFQIKSNGYIVIEEISLEYNAEIINDPDLNKTLSSTIANAMYTLIKKIVHGDKHHHQKIDTIIGVYTKFDANQILTDLGFQIKRLEKYVKTKNNMSLDFTLGNTVESTHNVAMGFMSYIRTLDSMFISSVNAAEEGKKLPEEGLLPGDSKYIQLSGIENVLVSIESMVNIQKNNIANSNKVILFIVTLIALFASLNIFYSTLIESHESQLALSVNNVFNDILLKYEWLPFLSGRDLAMGIILFCILLLLLLGKNAMGYYGGKWLSSKVKYSLYEIYTLARHLDLNDDEKTKYKNEYKKIKKYKIITKIIVLSFPFSLLGIIIGIIFNISWIILIFSILFFMAMTSSIMRIIKI